MRIPRQKLMTAMTGISTIEIELILTENCGKNSTNLTATARFLWAIWSENFQTGCPACEATLMLCEVGIKNLIVSAKYFTCISWASPVSLSIAMATEV